MQQTNLLLLGVLLNRRADDRTRALPADQVPLMMLAGALGILALLRPASVRRRLLGARQGWSYLETALQGSSFYKLPRVLQLFTGNIRFHPCTI
ncbi:MAG: hypothetical protein R3E12_01700 [Candidatus Eisenbacteria bacterium]